MCKGITKTEMKMKKSLKKMRNFVKKVQKIAKISVCQRNC